ncbi:MAG: hypothetical protein ACJAQ4_002508 [Cryomorphaceae bacterium]|jgi:hypothetical protein
MEVYFEAVNIGKIEGFKGVCFSREGAKTQRGGIYSSMKESR